MENKEKDVLTERERQIADLIIAEKCDKEIALILGVSPRTVRYDLDNAGKKLDVRGRVGLALWVACKQAVSEKE